MRISGQDVSTVIPTYRRASLLRGTLDSVAAQTVRPGEIVIADDGSPDDTAEVVAAFVADHPELHVVYLRADENAGMVANRNRGIRASSGAWIANLDDDDLWEPTKLERQLEVINGWTGDRPLVLLGTWAYNVSETLEVISIAKIGVTSEAEFDAVQQRGGVIFNMHASTMFPREEFEIVGGYDLDYGYAEDLSLFCRLADRGVCLTVPEPLYRYRKHGGSIQLVQFDSQNEELDRLHANRVRRVRGQAPLDRAAFAALRAAEPWRTRTRRRLRRRGMYHYRVAAVDLANGAMVRGGARLALAALLDPNRVIGGLRQAVDHRRSTRVD